MPVVSHFVADFDDAKTYETCRLQFQARDGERLAGAWLGSQVSLHNMLPRTREDCRELVSFKARRHGDPETLHHIASRVAVSAEAPLSYRINALVVSLYKSIEADIYPEPKAAQRAIVQAFSLIPQLSFAASMKEDRDQLTISLLTAAWHFFAHCQDRANFELFVDYVTKYDYASAWHPAFSFNMTKSCLLKALSLYMSGDRAGAQDMARFTVDLFNFATKLPAPNLMSFSELRVSLDNAIAAWRLSDHVATNEPIDEALILHTIRLATRVQSKAFLDKLRLMVGPPPAEPA